MTQFIFSQKSIFLGGKKLTDSCKSPKMEFFNFYLSIRNCGRPHDVVTKRHFAKKNLVKFCRY
jgi:hypothetical protein